MTLRSMSTKLYLGIGVAALLAWVAGVPGRTILSLGAVGLMIAMHAGGHGGHGRHGGHGGQGGQGAVPDGGQGDREERGSADPHLGHTGGARTVSPVEAAGQDTAHNPGSGPRGCH